MSAIVNLPRRKPKPTQIYDHQALASYRDRGVTHLEIWCVHLPCTNWHRVPIDALIERHGPGTPLVMVARRARCGICKRKGAHVQPEQPRVPGVPALCPSAAYGHHG